MCIFRKDNPIRLFETKNLTIIFINSYLLLLNKYKILNKSFLHFRKGIEAIYNLAFNFFNGVFEEIKDWSRG